MYLTITVLAINSLLTVTKMVMRYCFFLMALAGLKSILGSPQVSALLLDVANGASFQIFDIRI